MKIRSLRMLQLTVMCFFGSFALFYFTPEAVAGNQLIFAPTLLRPSNGATNQPTTVTLEWTSEFGATGYDVQVATNAAFTNILHDVSLGGTSYEISSLTNGTTYYWRVRSRVSLVAGDWSDAWSFTVAPALPTAPVLAAPNNGVTSQPVELSLQWNGSDGASSYRIQLATNSSFTTIIIEQDAIASTSYSVSSLVNSTTYYWRVSATNGAGSSAFSETWSFTTESAPVVPPSAPTLSSPADGAANQPTSLTVNWNASTGAETYRLQLAANSSFTSAVVDQDGITSTSHSVSGLANSTTYYWRVSAANSGGLSSFSDTWSFTTEPAPVVPPSAPTLSSPADGAANQPTSLTVSWNASTGAASYRLQVATDDAFSTLSTDQAGITSTSFNLTGLANGTTYYWRVNAANIGGTSPFSTAWSFSTTLPAVTPPPAPTLVSPANNSTLQSIPVTLSWNEVSGVSAYHLQISASSSFSPTVVSDTALIGTSHGDSTLQYNTTYYWRVRAKNDGGWGNFSEAWNFTTPSADAPIVSTEPATDMTATSATLNGTINPNGLSTDVKFNWGTNTNLENAVTADQSPVNGTEPVLVTNHMNGLSPNTTYYFRLFGTSSAGMTYGEVLSFTTGMALASPVLLTPTDGANAQTTSLILRWTTPATTTSFHLQVSTSNNFSSTLINQSQLADSTYQTAALSEGTTYFWRVRARNNNGNSNWSTVWSFTTVSSTPPATNLSSPSNGAGNQPTALELEWEASAGASKYALQVSADSLFTSPVVNDTSVPTTSRTAGPLEYSTTYFWRVRATNANGMSPWSPTWSFTTEPQSQQNASEPTSPPNGAINQPVTLTLRWSAQSGASSYDVQVSTTSTFATLVDDAQGVSGTSRQVGPLEYSTTYYWRVRTNYLLVTSEWSNVWTFSTATMAPVAPALMSPPDNSSDQPTIVMLQWNASNGAQAYHVQVATSSTFSGPIVNDSLLTTTSKQVSSLNNGTQYYWRVRAGNPGTWSSFSPEWSFTTATQSQMLQLNTTINFPPSSGSGYKPSDYRMVGIPGASEAPLSDLLTGTPGAEWQAYWDNGAPEDFLIEYSSGAQFTFSAGRAFWLIKRGQFTINTAVPPAPENASGEIEIPLHAGWNLITNPRLESIPWTAVQAANSVSEPVYTFGGSFSIVDSLTPFGGYYFHNATGLTTLRIPSSSAATRVFQQSSARLIQADDWRVQVSMQSGETTDNLLWLGASAGSSSGYDSKDFHKPRGFASQPAVYLDRPQWDSLYSSFASDIRPSVFESEAWEITITTPELTTVELQFLNIVNVPSELDVYLIDATRARAINLREESSYSFWPHQQQSTLRVVAGKREFVQQELQRISRPEHFVLGANYPNPFNPTTVIPFELPNRSDVTLEVYNLLGQKVKTLFAGTLEAGNYRYAWDGKNTYHSTVASGVYFYMLRTSTGLMLTKKMLLTK